jgi:O-acetyl-ADP-ribose deacetylase (regulator of RNase III)
VLGIRQYKRVAIDLFQGDITTFSCDVMVNAANSALAGGSGVDGAIHRAGGTIIMDECRKIGGCAPGEAVVTGAGNLPASHVIHAVGPIWRDGAGDEDKVLASAYKAALAQVVRLGHRHVAMPALSTGAYGFPVAEAAKVAINAVAEFLDAMPDSGNMRRITFVLFSGDIYRLFQEALFARFPE